jgi:CheY-like chemotaxis protein
MSLYKSNEVICSESISLDQRKTKDVTKGPIIIVEDDKDDQEIYAEVIQALGIPNELRFFDGGQPALYYLSTTEEQPFIILSDINMPGMSGLEFKKQMEDNTYLKAKGIPFVFISTDGSKVSVRHAHALSVQGYFQKPDRMEEIKETLRLLFQYWERCKHINNT